jgi:hypothetical protein
VDRRQPVDVGGEGSLHVGNREQSLDELTYAALNRLPRHDARDPIVRDVVRQRAADACEYCLMPTTGKFEIEHIIPKQRWNDYLTRGPAAASSAPAALC